MILPKVGEELGSEVKIRIDAVEPLEATVLAVDDFWRTRPAPVFEVGQKLVFTTLFDRHGEISQYNIEKPPGLPWFLLYEHKGRLDFEHYR